MQQKVNVRVDGERPIGTISPRLYGHFAEHLGRCCYDGLWAGDHFRPDVLQALREMPTPFLRWPGGCYADHYHWRDGIGPTRPTRLGMSCGLQVEDDNSLGTHEFLEFCEQIGAASYLAGNMGSGSVQEMCDWVEYCNTSVNTTLKQERESNGRLEPFGVKVWGVGNENWGCGGNYSPETYGLEYRRYATMLRDVDHSAEWVVCGQVKDWNERVLETLKGHLELVSHFSIHQYWTRGGPGRDFTEAQYYELLKEADETENFVVETRALIEGVAQGKRKIGIALDEWGVWHPEARGWGPDSCEIKGHNYEQACTLRDALAANAALEGFHRQCNSLSMCNLAQIVNVLHAPIRTEGDKMWLTPTYHVLHMHKPHFWAEALPVEIDGEMVSATASSKSGRTAVTVMNRHFKESAQVRLSLPGEPIRFELLASESAADENGPDAPERVRIQPIAATKDGNDWVIELPKHSVVTIQT